MSKPTIFIDGEAGTTGLQIRSRLDGRTDIELVSIAPDKRKDESERARLLNEASLVVLCLPDDAARQAVSLVTNPAVKILDASSAHRVAPGWAYGFPELAPSQPELIRNAARVSNPGCYPTGAIALLRPLIDAGLLSPQHPVTVNAISGYSGGGRQMIEEFEGRGPAPTADVFRLYGLNLAHKHLPEMKIHGRLAHQPLFAPSVGKFAQGMLVQIPLPLWAMTSYVAAPDLHAALSARYDGQAFVRVMPLESAPATLEPEALNGTNKMELFVFENAAERTALLVARLDNLGKGASGAAVQNMDLMLGLAGERSYALAAE